MTLYEWEYECKNVFTVWEPRVYMTETGEKLDIHREKEDMEKYDFVSFKSTEETGEDFVVIIVKEK